MPEMTPEEARRLAASLMGKSRSEKKTAAARENGKKGGRPRRPRPEDEAASPVDAAPPAAPRKSPK